MKPYFATRRHFLGQAGAIVAAMNVIGPRAESAAPGKFVVRAFDAAGAPLGEGELKSLLLVNQAARPFELLPTVESPGVATIGLPPRGSFELMMVFPVRGFGRLYAYADNAGQYYAPGKLSGREIIFNYECARSRAAFVRRYIEAARRDGVPFGPATRDRLERGEAALSRAMAARSTAEIVGHSNDSLAETMWAGEMAALERAGHRIRRQGPRPGFLFGSNAFSFARSETYARHYAALMNYATLPFYQVEVEKTEGRRDFSRPAGILEKMAGTNIVPKGHPLMFFHRYALPEFMKAKSWEQMRQSHRDYILDAVLRFRSRIHTWEIINEAHDWANDLNLSQEQLVEMTRFAAETTRLADPTAYRIVNSHNIWGEYVASRRTYTAPSNRSLWTPLDYVRAIEEARVPYEAVGLQLYNPGRDMLEIERQIERFFAFGKPVHITEIGIPSSSKLDRVGGVNPPTASITFASRNVWHGTEWTEEVQADWVEQFYTICYSKPQIEAISWWSFSDPAAIPYCGLLHPDFSPKQSYQRLATLFSAWKRAG